jgi:tetratricopeptide (TPR) repeat protein
VRKAIFLAALLLLALPFTLSAQEPTCEALAPEGVGDTFYLGLGDAYTTQGNYTQAIIVYDCAIERNSTYAPAFVNRGLAHAAQYNFAAALSDYNQAIELNDQLFSAYNNRGVLYSREANYALAVSDFTLLMMLAPDYAPAYHNRALVHAAEGNYDLAIADLQQAITVDPAYAEPHQALATVYQAMALESYAEYESLKVLPAEPSMFLSALRDSRESGDPSVWFMQQTTTQE